MGFREVVIKELATEVVEAFGREVVVSEIGALDRIAYLEYLQKLQKDGVSDERAGVLMSLFLMVKSVVEDGVRVFADEDLDTLAAQNIDLEEVAKIFSVAAKLNGLLAEGNG